MGRPKGSKNKGKRSDWMGEHPVICNGCGKEFIRGIAYQNVMVRQNRINNYCCRECYLCNAVRGEKTATFKGRTETVWSNGYKFKRIKPDGGKESWRREHVLIAEKALGRPLKQGEKVHHINGNKLDNRNTNLLICTNEYHGWLHQEMSRRFQQEHFTS